jgi:outer membrane receptor protein involved in Fe transport
MNLSIVALILAGPISNAAEEERRVSGTTIEEIVVTAQKREESINDVGMSIEASTGERLKELGITDAFDLYKAVAGFSSNVNYAGTAIYTIRGVGFQENSLATSPTVSVYLDEAPLQFSPMTRGASLDVQRVEALKGPQGTLFGQNATGGAVNFIANKPTKEFEAGVTFSYGEFDAVDIDGFVSGPLNDAWSYRLALRSQTSDDWQESYLSDEEAGSKDEFAYRAALAYDNNERTRLLFTLSGFYNHSDSLRPQLAGKVSQNPINGLIPGFLATPLAPKKAEAADWGPCANNNGGTPTVPNQRNYSNGCDPLEVDDKFVSAQVRLDYDLTDDIVLTSLTSYNHYEQDSSGMDADGTSFQIYEQTHTGDLETLFQEFRFTGSFSRGTWVAGVNYEDMETQDDYIQSYGHSSVNPVFGFIDYGPNNPNAAQDVQTWAMFANIEYSLNETVTLQAGVRYTDQERDFNGCTDDGGDGTWAYTSALIQDVLVGANFSFAGPRILEPTHGLEVQPGECSTTGPAPAGGVAGTTDYYPDPNGHNLSLNEDNTSWRVGVNWAASDAALVYGNISKAYKNGQFPTLPGSAISQLQPVVQEELLAYEIGAKATLADGSLQLNAAVFYYDYEDKQILGALEDAVFGSLPALVNVPESHVKGFELVATWMPVAGLTIAPSVSFADTEVDGEFRNFDAFFGATNFGTKDFSGQDFPQAPELQANLAISYSWEVMDGWTAFVGTHVNYQEETNSFFVDECKEVGVTCTRRNAGEISGDTTLPVPARTLVDVRAGMENDNWKVWLWGRNITDEYYWTRHSKVNDSIIKLPAMPRTVGITASYMM